MSLLKDESIPMVWVDDMARKVECTTTWDRLDPLVVRMTFHEETVEVVWVIARALLVEGLTSERFVGAGDVRVCATADLLRLYFKAPEGQGWAWLPRTGIECLLVAANRNVQSGSEHECDIVRRALDAELPALIGGAA